MHKEWLKNKITKQNNFVLIFSFIKFNWDFSIVKVLYGSKFVRFFFLSFLLIYNVGSIDKNVT